MLLIGTNNHHSSADQLVEGIEVIVWSITSKLPSAKVIVLVRQGNFFLQIVVTFSLTVTSLN